LVARPAIALAEALSAIGAHDEALRMSERAVRLGQSDPNAWYGAARVYARAQLQSEAKLALERAVAIAGPGLRAKASRDTILARLVLQEPAPSRDVQRADSAARR
jgi:tetratricopeptide (TPR) repeat protein